MDYKSIDIDVANVKALDDNTHQFSGYASVFGGIDSYGDSIVKGAYTKTLIDRKRPLRMYKDHNSRIVIGKWLEAYEDDKGLYVKGELTPGHSVAEDTYASLKHGAVDSMSIGYRVVDAEQRDGINFLKEIDLVEVSIVNSPADLNAQIGDVKSSLDEIDDIRQLEKYLRDRFDLSGRETKSLIACVKRFERRDVESNEDERRDVSSTKASLENQLFNAIMKLRV